MAVTGVLLSVFFAALALASLSILVSEALFNSKVASEVKEILKNSKPVGAVVQESEIEALPGPLRRYFEGINIIGKKKIKAARITQKGLMRTKPDQKWMPFTAEQYFTVNPPSFVWNVTVKPLFFVRLKGRDRYFNGKGNMLIKILPFFKVVDESGCEIDQGTLVRYFSEMIWFPTAFLSEYIKWEPIDNSSVLGTISYDGITASAILSFNEKGDFISFSAERYMNESGKSRKEKWSTFAGTYKEFEGIKVPVKGGAQWNLSSGDFTWIKLEITGIEYMY